MQKSFSNTANSCGPVVSEESGTGTFFPSRPSEVCIHRISSHEQQQAFSQHDSTEQSTSIDMEYPNMDEVAEAGDLNSSPSARRNFFTLLREARSQIRRSSSTPNSAAQLQNSLQSHANQNSRHNSDNSDYNRNEENTGLHFNLHSPYNPRNIRTWRMNLNNMFSLSSTPSTEAIRSIITSSGTFRYTPLISNLAEDNTHLLLSQQEVPDQETSDVRPFSSIQISSTERMSTGGNASRSEGSGSTPQTETTVMREGQEASGRINNGSYNRTQNISLSPADDISLNVMQEDVPSTFSSRNQNATQRNTQDDDDSNVISDVFIKIISHFVRYLPFICILFVKFVHDHLLGILDLLFLHGIMYQVNKSLRNQIAKFSHKSYGVLFRDFGLVGFVITYRFLLASASPDPFGLLISPPAKKLSLELASGNDSGKTSDNGASLLKSYLDGISTVKGQQTTTVDNTVTITKAISIGVLIYYVAVNDLVLKLITILIKISITLMPVKIIRHKPRARMYVVVEYLSQFYRSLAPLRQWLVFLFESYSGLEVISGILFSSFYMGAKGFEFVERGKSVKKALQIFLRNVDYERKPTKDELDSAGSLCPICHDTYSTPVVLECGHIFCDDCVSTWFKREQTCPMCRAKVSEDPAWQDGSTTFFYQLC